MAKHLVWFALLIMLIPIAGCDRQPALVAPLNSYRDVPGITDEQINAIAQLRERHDYFIYGMAEGRETFFAESGEIAGFSVHMSQWLGEFFGIEFIPAIYAWEELHQRLERGDIHFTGQIGHTQSRAGDFYMTSPIAMRKLVIVRRSDIEPLHYIDRQRPLRLVFFEGSAAPEMLIRANAFESFEPIFVNNLYQVGEALTEGYADGFISAGSPAPHTAFPGFTIEYMHPMLFYYASFSTRTEQLQPIVEVMQMVLDNGGMSEIRELYAKGMQDIQRHMLQLHLTDEEQNFISSNPIIPIIACGSSYPISFFCLRENFYDGVAFDILRQIEVMTGLAFEIVNPQPLEPLDMLYMLHLGEAAMTTLGIHPLGLDAVFSLSDGFFRDYFIFMSRVDLPIISLNETIYRSVGMVRNSAYYAVFRNRFPNHGKVHLYSDVDEALAALQRGEIEMVFSSTRGLLRVRNFLEQTGFRANIVLEEYYYVSFIIGENMTPLQSIINHSLGIIDSQAISDDWMGRTFDHNARMLQAVLPWLIGTLVLLGVVIVLLVALVRIQRVKSIELEKLVSRRTAELEINMKKHMEAEELTSTILDLAPMFVEMWDEDNKLIYCNPAIEKLLGVPSVEKYMQGMYYDLSMPIQPGGFSPEEKVAVMLEQARRDGYAQFEYICKNIAGEPVYINVTYIRIIREGKEVILGYNHDMRAVKEAMLKDHKAQENLKKAEAAKEESRVQTQFLARMSHEIRTPMNAVMGIADTHLRKGCVDSGSSEAFRKISHAAHTLVAVIDDILELSKAKLGDMEIIWREYDAAQMIWAVAQAGTQNICEDSEVNFALFVDRKLPASFIGDELRIKQLACNLITNAFKHTNRGCVSVSFTAEKGADDDDATLILSVADTGIGMTSEQVEAAFVEYAKFNMIEHEGNQGYSLGLPIIKEIIGLMGGEVSIKSTPGIGSIFAVRIPQKTYTSQTIGRETADRLKRLEEPAAGSDEGTPVATMPHARVMIVDDVETNLYVAEGVLELFGITEIDMVESGVAAISNIKQGNEYHIIFMDYMMPEMDGVEATKAIRSMGYSRPIVALSANTVGGMEETFLESGFDDFIPKPIDVDKMKEILECYVAPI